jgi:hypothetical protein
VTQASVLPFSRWQSVVERDEGKIRNPWLARMAYWYPVVDMVSARRHHHHHPSPFPLHKHAISKLSGTCQAVTRPVSSLTSVLALILPRAHADVT